MNMLKKELPIKIRGVADEDVPFIFNSWLKSYRESGPICSNVSNTIYYDSHHKLIQKILLRSQVFIACDNAFPDQIIGYIVGESIDGVFVLHYVYVKHNFRKKGVGKLLLNSFNHDQTYASCCTHMTSVGDKLAAKFNVMYHPYVILIDYDKPVQAQPDQQEEVTSENT
jgi:GNAT superfamily N-acetyltransferase